MSIHELFERFYSEQTDYMPWEIEKARMVNGSYSLPKIARAFMYFSAGFEANQGEKMQVIGFIDKKDADYPPKDDMVFLSADQGLPEPVPVYVKQCGPLKTGDEA